MACVMAVGLHIEWNITTALMWIDYSRMSVVCLTACNFLFPDSDVLSEGAYCVYLTIVLTSGDQIECDEESVVVYACMY